MSSGLAADAEDQRLTLLNSPFWTFHPTFCKGVRARWVDFRCAPPLAWLTIVCLGCVGASGLFNERDDLKSPMLCCAAGRRVTTATPMAWTRFVSITFQKRFRNLFKKFFGRIHATTCTSRTSWSAQTLAFASLLHLILHKSRLVIIKS